MEEERYQNDRDQGEEKPECEIVNQGNCPPTLARPYTEHIPEENPRGINPEKDKHQSGEDLRNSISL